MILHDYIHEIETEIAQKSLFSIILNQKKKKSFDFGNLKS